MIMYFIELLNLKFINHYYYYYSRQRNVKWPFSRGDFVINRAFSFAVPCIIVLSIFFFNITFGP